jgi:hypothetical protein
VVPRAKETLDHDRPAPAPFSSGGQDLAIDPLEKSFQWAGRSPFLMLKFIFMISFTPIPVKPILPEATIGQK